MPTGQTAASVPPQSIMSARPSRIASMPSPMAMFDAAQAVHWDSSGPRVPSSIETQPAPRFGMIDGIEKGLTRSGPRVVSVSQQSWNDFRPPMPVATAAPIRSASLAMSMPRVGLGLARRGEHEVREPVHAANLLLVHPVGRVEVLHLAGEVHGIVGVVELRDRSGAGLSGEQIRPRRLHVVPEGRDRAQPGDDDAPAPVV